MKTNNSISINNIFQEKRMMLSQVLPQSKLPDHIYKMHITTFGKKIKLLLEIEGLNGDNFHVKLRDNNTLVIIVAVKRTIWIPYADETPLYTKERLVYEVFMRSEIEIPAGYNQIEKVIGDEEVLVIVLSKESESLTAKINYNIGGIYRA